MPFLQNYGIAVKISKKTHPESMMCFQGVLYFDF